jgi:hypothetical protein
MISQHLKQKNEAEVYISLISLPAQNWQMFHFEMFQQRICNNHRC